MKLRENALQQANVLMEYKRAFSHHATHLGPKQNDEGGLLSIFVSLLAEPLSRTGNARTDSDHLTIELVLHLFRNLLAAEPLLKSANGSDHNLHHELVALLDRELVLEILLVLSADIEQRENAPYNLLLMELLQLLLRHQDPVETARAGLPKDARAAAKNDKENSSQVARGSLLGLLQREKQALSASATSRHSHFGGTLVLEKPGGRRQLVSAGMLGKNTAAQRQPRRRKTKRAEPFIGAPRNHGPTSPAAARAAATLHTFCQRFVATCYGPVMKSLKNEFRRDSVRLEDGDRVVFFQIVGFFCQWWRTARGLGLLAADDSDNSLIGQLIFTMDVFTFNLVLNATDTFQEHKKYGPLSHSVALLSEMMHLLHTMYSSNDLSTEHIMAMGLMDRLFYGSEPLDRLPKLLSRWTPGTSTREYLCDLTEVCHMTLKLLDASAANCSKRSMTALVDNKSDEAAKHDTVAKMKATVVEFDVPSYFARKIVSNHTVIMYTQLLSQYAINSPHVNHRVIAFLMRLSKHIIFLGDNESHEENMPENPLATKTVTLEPMLFNAQVLTVLNIILNDQSIRKDGDYAALLRFAASAVQKFAAAAQANPMLFIEALFKHPLPHRYCDLFANTYVTDDLRMLAERDLLLQQQQDLELLTAAVLAKSDDSDDDDDDEEVEFTDVPVAAGTKAKSTSISDDAADRDNKDKKESKRTSAAGNDTLADGDDEADPKNQSQILLMDSDDDSDADDKFGKRLKRSAQRSSQQTQDLIRRIRELDNDDQSSSSETEGIFVTDERRKTLPETKKPRLSVFSDSEDDN